MIRGGCHCGAVSYEVVGPIQGITHCHCETCRRINGTAFGSSAIASAADLTVHDDGNHLRGYESSPGKQRYFCRQCGSHLYAQTAANPGQVVLRVGTITGDAGIRSARHIWVGQKAGWYEISDDLPQHTRWPD